MGTMTPSQMYDHSLVTVKGPGRLTRLDYHAAPKTGESIQEGAACSIDSDGELIAGVPAGSAGNRPMPMFAIQYTDAFDANSDVGNISGGYQSAVVAVGGFEIQTTEYVEDTYAPNDLLTAATGGNAGKVEKASGVPYDAEVIVGCISKGNETNRDGVSVLTFWTMFLPAGS